jgi:hypothetical protein
MKKTHTQITLPTESRLLPNIHGRTNPFKRLAAAVIFQAMKDATCQMGRAKKSATTWLLQNDDGFRFWCNVLGMDPDQTRQELSDLLDSQMTGCKIDFQSLLHAPQDHRTLFADPQSSE